MTDFIKGMDLCERFYIEAVQPILKKHFPNLVYSAGRLDQGSEVLGFDTPISMDHDYRFYEAIHQAIDSPKVRSLPMHLGAIWQFADATDILSSTDYCRILTSVYEH